MKKIIMILAVVTLTTNVYANSAPVVSNVSATQRADDSKLVDIYYDLADADGDLCTVWISVSDNGGVSWRVPVRSCSGDIGQNISPGTNKLIVWDAGVDMPGKSGNFKTRVFADDGNGAVSLAIVPSGWFPYQNVSQSEDWIFVDSFMIDKYETTNEFYCQFLNDADPDGNYWNTNQEIDRWGDPGNYYYTVQSGRENYPIRYVSLYDAEAFAAWRSAVEGLTYRLPTEQEWEKAAGWDPILENLWTYGFQSDSVDCSRCNYNNCVGSPTEAGSYDPNKSYYGCYDMSGNVYEWTSSIYSGSSRVIRGGSWNYNAMGVAVAFRLSYFFPSARISSVGFRLVLDLN